jgi:hypothetical protein
MKKVFKHFAITSAISVFFILCYMWVELDLPDFRVWLWGPSDRLGLLLYMLFLHAITALSLFFEKPNTP